MKPKTVLSLLAHIRDLEDEIVRTRHKMRQLNIFHYEIRSITENFVLQNEAEQLAEIIQDRDFPLTHKEIKSIFETSGFTYNDSHVKMARPDSDEQTKAYRSEQDADYASVYGDSK